MPAEADRAFQGPQWKQRLAVLGRGAPYMVIFEYRHATIPSVY